jgi:hypothetical protein
MTYIKEAHGGVFRRVALSGLLESANRPHKKEHSMQTTRVIRYVHMKNGKYLSGYISAFIGIHVINKIV